MERQRTSPRVQPAGAVLVLAALLLAACAGDPSVPPTEEGPPGAGASGTDTVAACDDLEPTYDPPPEDQPDGDASRAEPSVDDGPAEHDTANERDAANERDDARERDVAEPDAAEPDDDAPDRAPAADETGDPLYDARLWAQQEAPEHFAGVWLEPEAGAPVIAFTEDVGAYAEEVRERYGDEFWVVEASYSEADLMELQEDIVASEMEEGGISDPSPGTVTTVGLPTPLNRVSIGVLDPDEARLAELGERYGVDRICVEVEPIADEDDAQPARWAPASDADLSAEATSIDVLVNEVGCASGEPADGRIATPEISYSDDAVVVTIRVVPRPGPQTCPSNPDTEYTLELDEPLGERTLLDGAHDPPAEPDLEDAPPDAFGDPGPADSVSPAPADG